MTIPFIVSGAATAVPGVYSTFFVQNSLPAPAPAGRSVLIAGEATDGAPSSVLDLRLNYFTDFNSVRAYYGSGPICDAARMLFSNQPSPVFGGAIQRLYVYKTNEATRASKAIASPSNYGSIVAYTYSEAGNQIKSQITVGRSETKPSKTFLYLPSPNSRTYKVVVDGTQTAALTVAANGTGAALVTAMAGVSGLSTTGGAARTTTIDAGPMTANVTPSGDQLTISQASGGATFDASIAAGDCCYIAAGSAAAGGSNQNAGSYVVVSVTSTTLVLKQLKSNEANAQAMLSLSVITLAATDLKINAPVTMAVTAATPTGAGATLELMETNANIDALGMFVRDQDMTTILSAATAAVASVSATVPGAGQLQVSLTGGSMTIVPQVGDMVRITRASELAGATQKNVGMMVVTASNAQSLTLQHLFAGMTTEAVASTKLNGDTLALLWASSFASTSVAGANMTSSAEQAMKLVAGTIGGSSMPTTLIGGNVCLELGYWDGTATACTVSIDATRTMTITPSGGSATAMTIKTLKYASLEALVDYLNTLPGVSAEIADNRYKSLPCSVLDMVNAVPMLDGQSNPAYNARLKKDWYDWNQYFANNTGLLSFAPGTIVLQAGLPAAEASGSYLSGAAVGPTSNADVQAALDAGLQIDVRMVVTLFSRDAQYDIADGNTDSNSSYTIDSINAAAKAHASTASAPLMKKRRFANVSFDGSYADTLQKVSALAYERCQMTFQRHIATNAAGSAVEFLPWMAACAIAAGRAQAQLGTSMLRKPFLLNSADHFGNVSLYTNQLTQDFSPDNNGQLNEAISAGLVVFRAVSGFGIRMESPDLSSRSRNNDPQAWTWERVNVLFTCDEVIGTMESTLDNFIGNRTSDTPTSVIKTALESVISTYVSAGALLSGKVLSVTSLGNQYSAQIQITPTEALEAIVLTVEATRST